MTALEQASPAARRAAYASTATVCVLAAVMAVAAMLHQPAPPTVPASAPARVSALTDHPDDEATVLFVGDSYTAGYAGVSPNATFACQVAAALQWQCRTDAQGGTGYTNPGLRPDAADRATRTYGQRLALTAADLSTDDPDWIVVTGGRNDIGRPGERAAAAAYLTALGVLWPRARLVVVEPWWTDTRAPAAVEELRDDVRSAARAAGALWIDTSDWLTPDLIGPDKVHPTPAGQARIADRLTEDLERITNGDN